MSFSDKHKLDGAWICFRKTLLMLVVAEVLMLVSPLLVNLVAAKGRLAAG